MAAWQIFLGGRPKALSSVAEDLDSLTRYIKTHTGKDEKIVVWGFYPEIYVLAERMPATRYIYSCFLTGLITGANTAPEVDDTARIVPGTWDIFMEEIEYNMPKYIVDTTPGGHMSFGKYPPSKFKRLWHFINENYVLEKNFFDKDKKLSFRLFRRIRWVPGIFSLLRF